MAASVAASPPVADALTPDQASALYSSLLSDFVSESGVVDYAAMRADPRLDAYCSFLSSVDPSSLQEMASVAFWCNVYNAFTLQLICRSRDDLRSINELHLFGSLIAGMATKRTIWHTHKIRLGGAKPRDYTLDEIEHKILRGDAVADARIHASINCASGSCPRLSRQPFTSDQVALQMDSRMRDFIRSHAAVSAAVDGSGSGKLVRLNKIFSWFAGDFEREVKKPGMSLQEADKHLNPEQRAEYTDDSVASFDWRSIQPSIVQYVFLYAALGVKKRIIDAQTAAPKTAWTLEYDEYDWKLNGKNK